MGLKKNADSRNNREVINALIDYIQGDSGLYGYQEQFEELYELVDQTVSTGGSNSVLLLGPRGVGKKVLVNQVLNRVTKESKVFQTDGLTVRLNGLVETDDKLALKEIKVSLMSCINAPGGQCNGVATFSYCTIPF